MSGRAGTNIVPMPTQAQAPAPMAYPWPMPPGGFPAGCCPPGGMDALMQCYCDIQAATAFISKVVQDLAANDPAFQQSLVDAIAASGSNIPLIGVTNGSFAQPGQVGEVVQIVQTLAYPGNGATQVLSVGVLQPGDWDIWGVLSFTTALTFFNIEFSPSPPGVMGDWEATVTGSGGYGALTPLVPGSFAAPTLFALNLNITSGTAGTMTLYFRARRVR